MPWTDPAEYDEDGDPSGPRPWAHLSRKTPTTSSIPKTSCVHVWRACTGKYGCYWWCNRCKKTRNVTIQTLQEWKNLRNDSQSAIEESIQLWKIHTT